MNTKISMMNHLKYSMMTPLFMTLVKKIFSFFPADAKVNISLMNIKGVNLVNLYSNYLKQGENTLQLDLSRYPSGTYFISLDAGGVIKEYKVILNK